MARLELTDFFQTSKIFSVFNPISVNLYVVYWNYFRSKITKINLNYSIKYGHKVICEH